MFYKKKICFNSPQLFIIWAVENFTGGLQSYEVMCPKEPPIGFTQIEVLTTLFEHQSLHENVVLSSQVVHARTLK
jgi:hypothetical protein